MVKFTFKSFKSPKSSAGASLPLMSLSAYRRDANEHCNPLGSGSEQKLIPTNDA